MAKMINTAKIGLWAEETAKSLFERAGWQVVASHPDHPTTDLRIARGRLRYAVEIKTISEGRADRLIPLWSQGYLQARRYAPDWKPLILVAAPAISERVTTQVASFASEHAPDAAIGVMDQQGRRAFQGEGLEGLDAEPDVAPLRTSRPHVGRSKLFFSDVNQWLLKALLAIHLPENLTGAPRGAFRNASELSRATKVSVMSAFRLVETLKAEGHLDGRNDALRVVRRRELLERWRAWCTARVAGEVSAVFLLPGNRAADVRNLLEGTAGPSCLALFAAADALGLGFVKGAPPTIYLPKLNTETLAAMPALALAQPGEAPHLLLREAPARRSVFRAAVRTDHGLATDVLQTWLDVSSHPTRGREQADLIERRVLRELMQDD